MHLANLPESITLALNQRRRRTMALVSAHQKHLCMCRSPSVTHMSVCYSFTCCQCVCLSKLRKHNESARVRKTASWLNYVKRNLRNVSSETVQVEDKPVRLWRTSRRRGHSLTRDVSVSTSSSQTHLHTEDITNAETSPDTPETPRWAAPVHQQAAVWLHQGLTCSNSLRLCICMAGPFPPASLEKSAQTRRGKNQTLNWKHEEKSRGQTLQKETTTTSSPPEEITSLSHAPSNMSTVSQKPGSDVQDTICTYIYIHIYICTYSIFYVE